MAQNIFNLYSASIFAEHPSSLWTLDDDVSFISLIGGSAQWTLDNSEIFSPAYEPQTSPVETVGIGDINVSLQSFRTTSSDTTMRIDSQEINTSNCSTENPTICASTFLYSYDGEISSIKIGFSYYSEELSTTVEDFETFENIDIDSWNKISHTIFVPIGESSIDVTSFIEVSFANNDNENKFSLYNFSVGQWSEQYNIDSSGISPTLLTNVSQSTTFINSLGLKVDEVPRTKVYEADKYGFDNYGNGYYWIYGNKLLALNSKLPMVFGSGNITEIRPPKDEIFMPSVTIPGNGFLHESGKYKEITAEFWMRVNCSSEDDIKIFGPIASSDGLYINKNFITIYVGHKKQSYFIGKWYRPMLIDIRYNPFFVSLLINGDEVAKLNIEPQDTLLAQDEIGYETDWLGFFATNQTQPFDIDAIAIYPYIVSEQAAKRKFVYGQGVGKPEEIIKRFGGISTTIDFPFAEYTKNVIYPDMTKWSSGYYSNITATSSYLSLPEYELPEITYVGENLSPFTEPRLNRTWLGVKESSLWGDWRSGVWRSISATREANALVDNYDLQSELSENFYLKLTPNSVYDNLYGAISFKTMNPINEKVASILGVFSLNSTEPEDIQNDSDTMTLFYFKNRSTGEYLNIVITLDKDVDGNVQNYYVDYIFNGSLLERQSLAVEFLDTTFIAGINIDTFSETYRSTIKNFFSNQQNISLNVGGQDRNEFTGKIYRITFNNKMFTNKDLGNYFMNTGSAKCKCSVTPNYFETFKSYIGNYTLLFKKANSSMIMDIGSAGYWENSIPLSSLGSYIKDKDGNPSFYDLDAIQFNIEYPSNLFAEGTMYSEGTGSNLSSYATIQRYEDVGKINYSNYTVTKDLSDKRYIDFDNQEDNIDITKYRFVDGSIAFPPKSKVDFNDAYITLHLELRSEGINTSPIKINRMSMASLAFDQRTLYALNSPTGNKFYPFTRQSTSYSNKIKNPFLIYKDSTPYLYLTGDSGAQVLPYSELVTEESNYSRGLSISINPKKKSSYNIYGFHLWVNYNKDTLVSSREKLFSIYSNDKTVNFYIEPESSNTDAYQYDNLRGSLVPYLYDISGEEIDDNTVLYQNGVEIKPYLYPMSWSLITVRFKEPMNFDNTIGQLEIYPGIIFNNVALFESSIDGKVDDIFESHLGLSNIVAQDSSTLSLDSDGLDIFTSISWSPFSGKAV